MGGEEGDGETYDESCAAYYDCGGHCVVVAELWLSGVNYWRVSGDFKGCCK
jgi:hypothetical protein